MFDAEPPRNEAAEMTTLYLIRHGHNEYVGKGKLAGWTPGVHLSEIGEKQATALAEVLSGIRFQAVYTSPLERTIETAQPLAESQRLKPIIRKGLGEIKYGTWTGKSLKVLRRRKLWPLIQVVPSLAKFPEGESFQEAQARVVNELEHIRASHSGKKATVACVFHSDPIKLAIAYYLGLPIDLFQRLIIQPASFTILSIGDHGTRLVRLNDTQATDASSLG